MTDYLTEFLTVILREQGVENPHDVARKAADDLRRAKLVDRTREDVVSRRVRIYELRVTGMPVSVLAIRFGICQALVKREVAAELKRRRLATAV